MYLIALLEDFTLDGSPGEDFIHDIGLCHRSTGRVFYDKLGYIYIELVKFVKAETDLVTELDKWLYVLKHMSSMNKLPIYLRKPIFEKLFNIAEYTNLSKEEKNMYDSSLKFKWDNKNVMDFAIQQATEEGIKKGIEKGKKEEAIAIALKFLQMGIPIEDIARGTGLSTDEIKHLQDNA